MEKEIDGFQRVLAQAQPYLSDGHFTVDGTLIGAWSQKSFHKKPDGNDKLGEYESQTDPEARLYRQARCLCCET